jgi:HicA toxin of bacterial toxin-antitoxin,
MNAKHKRTLEAIFTRPIPAGIRWAEIESLLAALGAERSEGRGSRVRFLLHGERAVFHRPHPKPETDKGAVAAIREFLERAGTKP